MPDCAAAEVASAAVSGMASNQRISRFPPINGSE
jgi:hypothetical protein